MGIIDHKVFRDSVHGYVSVPIDLVRLFVDTEIFQRLRNIEQTGMRTVYPSARHDRFIHSLGTFHLGNKAYISFRKNTKEVSDRQLKANRKHFYVFDDDDENEIFWNKCEVLFEIACLLHDCGHAPFSHTLEFLYEFPSKKLSLRDKLRQYISSSSFTSDFIDQGSQHECMSALVVCAEYRQNINDLVSGRKLNGMDDQAEDLEFIVRMIIGCKYSRDSKENRIKNCFISLLNSNSIDVDSLDYIVRDSKLSGIDNMSVDVDRLLNSLTLVEKTVFKDKPVYNAEIRTNILNGSIKKTNRESAAIYGQHQGVTRITNFNGKMTGSISAAGNLKIEKDIQFKPANSNVLKVGAANYAHTNRLYSIADATDVELFGITEEWLEVSGASLKLNKEQNGRLECQADAFEVDSVFINGNITGILSGELLGCYEDIGGKLICELGFHKSSLSVIQNVLVARNYEYQWIYSHHKVVYYSNYLIIDLLRECIKFLLEREGSDPNIYEDIWTGILSWENMIEGDDQKYHPYKFDGVDYFRPVDSDILALFRKCSNICMKEEDTVSSLSRLLTELFTRVYRKSLWKSYAEYNIFFSFLSDYEKKKVYDLVLANRKHSVIDQYGYFNDKWEAEFKQFGLKNVIWVNADSKLKVLNPDNTCILFKDTTLNYRTVSLSQDIQIEQRISFFYIYFEEVRTGENIDIDGVKNFIHEQLKSFI